MAKHAGEKVVRTLHQIIKTGNNTLLRQMNGVKLSIKFFNVGQRKEEYVFDCSMKKGVV